MKLLKEHKKVSYYVVTITPNEINLIKDLLGSDVSLLGCPEDKVRLYKQLHIICTEG